MLNPQDPSLVEGVDSSTKSTANTRQKPKRRGSLGRKLVQELIDSGIPYDHQHLLNYQDVSIQKAFELTGHKYSGWLVLYTDLNGRPYVHEDKSFYRLKPDAGQITDGKYRTISGAGNRPYFSPFLRTFDLKRCILGTTDLIITEGEKKTDSLVFNGFPTIGLAGVWSWTDKRVGKYEMLPELEAINWSDRNVFIMFDSDVLTKDSVKKALKALCDVLTEKKAKVRVVTLPCDLDGTKNGADDFLVKYGKEALSQILKKARPSHEKKKYIWVEEPKLTHHIAITASVVFKKVYALRPEIGLYKWVGTRWELIGEKPITAIDVPLHTWLDHMIWERRESSHLKSVKDELLTRIKHSYWNTPNLLSFKNGTLDVNNQKFTHSHNRSDYLTHSFDFKYDEEAQCPTWINFINETFDNNQELIELLRAAFKWSICPKDISQPFLVELFFDLYGRKGSGKGTTLEVLKAIAGGKDAIGSLRNDFRDVVLFGLIGKKVAINNDASGHISDAGIFDSIVTNEEVPVKKLFFNQTLERLGVVVWRAFNDNPTASGGGVEGLGRRMVTFPFPRSAANPDHYLKTKLFAEVEGIFWWCWSMDDNKMFDVFKNRGSIAAVAEANIENQLENQPVLQFIYDLDGEYRIQSSDLYRKYKDWCDEVGKSPVSQTKFGKELNKMEGFVHKDIKSSANYYSIHKKEEINLAKHFGISNNGRSNPPALKVANPNPPASNPPNDGGTEKTMEGMESSNNKNSFKNKKDSIYIEKEKEETLQTLQPSMLNEKVPTGSAWDTNSDDDDPHWPKRA